jgi:hypothetical protein
MLFQRHRMFPSPLGEGVREDVQPAPAEAEADFDRSGRVLL